MSKVFDKIRDEKQMVSLTGMDFMNTVIDAVPNVSVVAKIEVLGFNAPEQHYQTLTNFI